MYKDKYLKYKNKYLLLKNQYGSSSHEITNPLTRDIVTDKFYLPCDITHYTSDIYHNNDVYYRIIKELFEDMRMPVHKLYFGKAYAQDPYIQLYDGDEKYFNIYNSGIVVKSDLFKEKTFCDSDVCILKHKFNEDFNKTVSRDQEIVLNFIYPTLSSCNVIKNNVNILTGKLNTDFLNFVDIYNIEKRRTIEELIIKKLITIEEPRSIKDQIIIHDRSLIISKSIEEQSKGGNFISGPTIIGAKIPIFYISGISENYKLLLLSSNSILIELNCSFSAADNFRHIDELMCFMPYGKKEDGTVNYKIWFYDNLDIDSLSRHKYASDLDQRDRELADINEERIVNLDKICWCLFNGTYVGNEDKFVFFKFYDYYPSILNRLWIETHDKSVCIYPKQKSSRIDGYNNNYVIFEKEIPKIKSCINPDKIVYFTELDVLDANPNEPEGGPHCLFKQRFTKII